MWCNPRTGLLVSSGDDGLLHQWQPASWGGRSAPAPLRTMDMNKWVSPDLRGPPLRLDTLGDKEDTSKKMGSPAAVLLQSVAVQTCTCSSARLQP